MPTAPESLRELNIYADSIILQRARLIVADFRWVGERLSGGEQMDRDV